MFMLYQAISICRIYCECFCDDSNCNLITPVVPNQIFFREIEEIFYLFEVEITKHLKALRLSSFIESETFV